jgi:protein phosphatase PTC7
VATGGEDALFAASHAVGIADGVGGWASQGIDAGEISRALMSTADALATADPRERTALQLLRDAWSRVAAQRIQGSTTAVLAALRGTALSTANLGDSGFVLYRDGQALHRSVPLCHDFNTPLQLGPSSSDTPGLSRIYEVEVRAGDVLLMSTDGLFDNLFPEEIDRVMMLAAQVPQTVAAELALKTFERSIDMTAECPFTVECRKAGYTDEIGGKPDDITVLVATVTEAAA